MITTLEKISVFQGLDSAALTQISSHCQPIELGDGEILVSEHDTTNYDLFALISGKVEILSRGLSHTSSEIALSNQEKDLIGEIAWLTRGQRTATVRCLGDVEAIRINGDALTQYLETNARAAFIIMRNLAKLLATRLSNTDNLLKQLLWNMHL